MAIRAKAYSSVRRLLPALFSTHPHLEQGDCQPPSADYTEERYASGAVLLHLERRTEAYGGVGTVPFDPEPRGTAVTDVRQIRGGLSTGAIGADELLANACDCGAGKC